LAAICQPLVTQAGLQILREGGNTTDVDIGTADYNQCDRTDVNENFPVLGSASGTATLMAFNTA
jgi:hypothetical protein